MENFKFSLDKKSYKETVGLESSESRMKSKDDLAGIFFM